MRGWSANPGGGVEREEPVPRSAMTPQPSAASNHGMPIKRRRRPDQVSARLFVQTVQLVRVVEKLRYVDVVRADGTGGQMRTPFG